MSRSTLLSCPACAGGKMFPGDVVCGACERRVKKHRPDLLGDYANRDITDVARGDFLRGAITGTALKFAPKPTSPSPRGPKLLTAKQRTYLATLAREGWKRTGAGDDESFDDWRHRQCADCLNDTSASLSTATAAQFDALLLHFKILAGKATLEDTAENANELRQLAHAIFITAKEAGVTEGYVAGICKRMFHRSTWSGAEEGRKVLNALRYHRDRVKKGAAA